MSSQPNFHIFPFADALSYYQSYVNGENNGQRHMLYPMRATGLNGQRFPVKSTFRSSFELSNNLTDLTAKRTNLDLTKQLRDIKSKPIEAISTLNVNKRIKLQPNPVPTNIQFQTKFETATPRPAPSSAKTDSSNDRMKQLIAKKLQLPNRHQKDFVEVFISKNSSFLR